MRRYCSAITVCVLLILGGGSIASAATPHRHIARHKSHKALVHKAGWAGAGVAAGQIAGPAGGAAVGATHYRKDLKAGGHRRTRAAVKIGAPIAATAVAGPVGTVGYGAYEERHFIKKHLVKHHHRHRARRPALHVRSTLGRTR